jgi:hypothetical protein
MNTSPTDRELLEAAATAAGIYYWIDADAVVTHSDTPGSTREWNPLTDDGDALRLAVKADIDLVQFSDFARADYMIGTGYFSVNELYGTDPLAATRRAIVRAAAEIGKEMK